MNDKELKYAWMLNYTVAVEMVRGRLFSLSVKNNHVLDTSPKGEAILSRNNTSRHSVKLKHTPKSRCPIAWGREVCEIQPPVPISSR